MTEHDFTSTDDTDNIINTNADIPFSEDTILDEVRKEMQSESVEDVRWLVVPARPNFSLAFSIKVDFDILQRWMRAATDRRKKQFNALTFAHIVLSNQSRGVKYKGQTVSRQGVDLTLADEEFWDILGVSSTRQAITRLFDGDGYIMAASQEVLEAAGYGDTAFEDGEDEGDGPFDKQ